MKYKLIKEYPGSPKLGTIASGENKSSIWEGSNFYNKYPEYWEKVNENLWYVVSTRDYQESNMLFQEWLIYMIETCLPNNNGVLHYFKTRLEAEQFALYNKPCLSINDIGNNIPEFTLNRLIQTVKSKL